MGWEDREESRVRDAEPQAEYPWIQWVNRGGDLEPRHDGGGFFITDPNMITLNTPVIDGFEPCNLVFSNDTSASGTYLPQLDIAVLESRFAWLTRDSGRNVLSQNYSQGARGKLQVLVLLRTQDSAGYVGPLMITLTGTVTKDMSTAIKKHRQLVRQATAGNGAAAWFWMTAAAGTPERRGRDNAQSTVTPIVLVESAGFDPDAVYIGDDLADMMEDSFDLIQQWATAWTDDNEPADTSETQAAESYPDEFAPEEVSAGAPQPTANVSQLAKARQLWSDQWNRLKQLKLAPPLLDNSWSSGQIQTATIYMKQSIEAIEHGASLEITAAELISKFETI